MTLIDISITPGEFCDRLSILAIKTGKLGGDKQAQARKEIYAFLSAREMLQKVRHPDLTRLYDELKVVNTKLWEIEDEIRALDGEIFGGADLRFQLQLEPAGCDGGDDVVVSPALVKYVKLARSVYVTNDERSRLKAEIDKHFGVQPEVKEYSEYDDG